METSLRPSNPKGNTSDRKCLALSRTSTTYQILAPLAQPNLVQSSTNVNRYRSVASIQITEIAHHCIKRNSLWGHRRVWIEITKPTNRVLFQGCGPVDGPNETRSSIRGKTLEASQLHYAVSQHWQNTGDRNTGANSDGLLEAKQPSIKFRWSPKTATLYCQHKWASPSSIEGPLESWHSKYQVNRGYLRAHTQSKHKWSDKVWDMIDMTTGTCQVNS